MLHKAIYTANITVLLTLLHAAGNLSQITEWLSIRDNVVGGPQYSTVSKRLLVDTCYTYHY